MHAKDNMEVGSWEAVEESAVYTGKTETFVINGED